MKFVLKAILKLHSPLHIAAPGNKHFDVKTGETTFKQKGEGIIPCTAIQTLKLASIDKESRKELPVIAANNIAGRLRRHAARLVLDALAAKGEKVSQPTYLALMCGAATGQPAGEDLTYSEYQQASAHPYLGLFGGGPKMLRRRFRVHNALPFCFHANELRGPLCHPEAGNLMQNIEGMVTAWAFRRNDDIRAFTDMALAERSIEDFVKVFSDRQAKILEEATKDKDSGEEKSKTSTRTYSALEFVVPGTAFDLLVEGEADKVQMGLFLASLDSFCATERLGGYSRNGFGVFSLNDVRLRLDCDEEKDKLFDNGRLVSKNEPASEFLSAWEKAAKKLSAADLEGLLRVPDKKEKKEKEPGEKRGPGRPKKEAAA